MKREKKKQYPICSDNYLTFSLSLVITNENQSARVNGFTLLILLLLKMKDISSKSRLVTYFGNRYFLHIFVLKHALFCFFKLCFSVHIDKLLFLQLHFQQYFQQCKVSCNTESKLHKHIKR